jgi:hypothetical protein
VRAFIDRLLRFLDAASRQPDLELAELLKQSRLPGASPTVPISPCRSKRQATVPGR